MHIITVSGNVGRDPELRHTNNGKTVLAFSLASKDRDRTEWFECAVWGERATSLQPHIKKGQGLTVVGVPYVDAWTKDGEARAKFKVNVDRLDFHSGGKRDEQPQSGGAPAGSTLDDRIPFAPMRD